MRLGISLPTIDAAGRALDAEAVMTRARWIEEAGFDSIWMGDTFGRMMPRPDPLMWLLAAATATKRVELGTAIVQLPLRNPVEFSQRVMTMMALTNGRFTLGVGAGSPGSHAAIGADYASRNAVLRSNIDVVRRLCSGEKVGDAYLNPWPEVAQSPSILIGTWASSVWLKRAAQDYDGWIASASTSFDTLAEGMKRFREAGGKRAIVASLLIDVTAPDSVMPDDGPFDLMCTPRTASERLERLADLGFDDALLIKTDHRRVTNLYETDYDADELALFRSLIPSTSARVR